MLRRLSGFFERNVERYMPDPLVVAILLTAVVLLLSVSLTSFDIIQTVDAWGGTFWGLLTFTTQMILIIALGHIVAHTGPVQKGLLFVANKITTAKMAYMSIVLVSSLCSLVSWGIGLVAPVILARAIARNLQEKGVKVHYPLLIAGGYAGSQVWHHGLSSSIPLSINTPGHFLESTMGLIATGGTIFSNFSMSIALFVILTLPFLYVHLAPGKGEEIKEFKEMVKVDEPVVDDFVPETPAEKLENTPILTISLGGLGAFYIVMFFMNGGGLNLNIMNLTFLSTGLLFSKNVKHFVELLGNAAKVIGPFLIQYPMYAGLMGVMAASGLGQMIVEFFVSFATAETLPLWTFISAGMLNLFIPSGGGQWAVQGPIVVEAAIQLGTDLPRIAMAVAFGDTWTNAIQPFYAVPVLAIAGLNIRDILGYGFILLIFMGLVLGGALYFF